MKILVTGAHFTPAQATIEELKKFSDVKIVYVGRKYTMEGDKTLSQESQIIPKMGVKFYALTTGRLRRNFDFLTLWSLLKIPFGLIQSFYFVVKEDPDVILSFGGYVAVPVVISGWLLSKKIIVHEQTLVSGLANQVGNLFADKIAVSFEKDYGFNKAKVVLTGNPVRQEIIHPVSLSEPLEKFIRLAKKEKKPVILVTAGNQGSLTFNRNILESMDDLTQNAYLIHQTGDSKYGDFEKLQSKKMEISYPDRYLAQKWINGSDMGALLKRVDLVVSRSGANTMVELSFFGVPTLAIPLPHLYKDEQMVNAKFFKELGLCEILPQSELSPTTLLNKVKHMLSEINRLKIRAKKAKKIVVADAAKRLALETNILLNA